MIRLNSTQAIESSSILLAPKVKTPASKEEQEQSSDQHVEMN